MYWVNCLLMEILEISRSYLKVRVGKHTANIAGEGFVREFAQGGQAPGYVDYIVYPNTFTHWEAPAEEQAVSAAEKQQILDFLKGDFTRRGQVLGIE